MFDSMSKDELDQLRQKRFEAFDKGEYTFKPPDVACGNWSREAWCNWVNFNNKSLNGFIPYR